MSRSSKKTGRRVNRQRLLKSDLCDVTLNDFANSSLNSASGRLKKPITTVNQVIKEVKQLNLVEDSQTWEEKLNILELPVAKEDEKNVTEKKSSSHRKKKNVASPSFDDESGNDYPIDIWFLISEYIHPEDVGKFAAICKTSLAVVSTAKFWFSLYKRYYRNVANLPEQFQPTYMVRRYGLRAQVIRALHIMYPPFITKLRPLGLFDDPHLLTKRICVLAWFQKIKNHWLFCFKLKKPGSVKCEKEITNKKSKSDLLEMLEDLTANVDDNCKVLQVTCLNYIILPMLSGQVLGSVSLNVSQGMSYHRLQLNFGSGPFPNLSSNQVILDPVTNIRVLDWWHPSFPHSDVFNTSLFSSETALQQFEDFDF